MKNISFISVLIILSLTYLGCRKTQPDLAIESEDPCVGATEVSADFDILEILSPTGSWEPNVRTPTDIILGDKNVEFRAKMEDADSYTWYIGTEVLDTRSVVRFFDGSMANQNVTVSLVVRSKTNAYCLPNDDGYDSISKTFGIRSYCDSTLMEGWFRVALVGETDSIDFGFDFRTSRVAPTPEACNWVDVYNYNLIGDTLDHYTGYARLHKNYRWVKMTSYTAINPYNSFGYKAEMTLDNVFHLYITRGLPLINTQQDTYPEIYRGRKL